MRGLKISSLWISSEGYVYMFAFAQRGMYIVYLVLYHIFITPVTVETMDQSPC